MVNEGNILKFAFAFLSHQKDFKRNHLIAHNEMKIPRTDDEYN